jgi:hypothetical protein
MYNFLEVTKKVLTEKELEKAKLRIENGKSDSSIWAQWIMEFFCS